VLLALHASIRGMVNTHHFKERLEAEKKTLEEELGQIAIFNTETNIWEATPDQDMMGEIDDNDAADRFEDFEERTSMASTLQARLSDVIRALTKIDAGAYGNCEVSNEPIEEDRLEANPAARTSKAHMND
jgi:RNA polymerase-binding transcription factor DksA